MARWCDETTCGGKASFSFKYLKTKCSNVKEVRAAVTENPRSLGRLELMLVFLPILPRFSLRQRLRLLDAFAASPTAAAPLGLNAAVWSFAVPFLNEREELGGARAGALWFVYYMAIFAKDENTRVHKT